MGLCTQQKLLKVFIFLFDTGIQHCEEATSWLKGEEGGGRAWVALYQTNDENGNDDFLSAEFHAKRKLI